MITLADILAAIDRAADVLTRSDGRYTQPFTDLVRALAVGALWSPLRLREAVQRAWEDGEAIHGLLAGALREYLLEHPDPAVEMRIGDLGTIEPAAGWEERAVERAQADGLFTRRALTLDEVLALIDRAAEALAAGDDSDHEALVRHLGRGVLSSTEQLRAAVIAAWPILSAEILIAAREYEEETRRAPPLAAADPDET